MVLPLLRGALAVAGQRIHVGMVHAGRTVTVETADTTWRIYHGDESLTEVARTTPKPVARFKAANRSCLGDVHRLSPSTGMLPSRFSLLPMGSEPAKIPFDLQQYEQRVSQGPCFVCGFVERRPDHHHHLVYEDDDTVAFLNRYPTLLGYCLVAPKRHLESWVHDMDPREFLQFQSVVHAVARAIAAAVPTERMYSMSLGSQQRNAHLHWHLAPLPPGIPYHQQQFHAVMAENGILAVDDGQQAALAQDIGRRIQS